jgi:5-enolpyruvylshikimate-3-phosphate synthase
MALAVAGLAAAGTVTIDDTGPAAVTFPEFFRLLTELGARIENLEDVP